MEASSCHPDHCKTSIPYSQALRLNRICSDTSSFDRRCNELEAWLIGRGYDERLVRSKVLNARKFSRSELLNKERAERRNKLTLNIVYHPVFRNLSKLLNKIHILLACDKEHHRVFPSTPVVGFRRGKSLKDMLVRAKVPELGEKVGKSEACKGKRCGVCPFINQGSEFFGKDGKRYTIRDNRINCNSINVVYLLSCKACGIQYVGSCTTKFRLRFNNYRSCYNRHTVKTVPQQNLHNHFDLPGHNGFSDFQFTLIDKGNNEDCLRRRERFWQYKLQTFLPYGLNDCEVYV